MRRGAVVLVPFRFTDRSGTKWRPAAVVSSDTYNQMGPDVLIAAITSNLGALPHAGDHPLADWKAAGLPKPSLLQAKLATIEASMLGRRLGHLSAADMAAFSQSLRKALNLT